MVEMERATGKQEEEDMGSKMNGDDQAQVTSDS